MAHFVPHIPMMLVGLLGQAFAGEAMRDPEPGALPQCTPSSQSIEWQPEQWSPERRVLRVGTNESLKTPSQAAITAKDGDVVLIEAGDYVGDTAVWRQNGLLIRGINGRPRLVARGPLAEQKALWVIKGADVTVENVEFTGARVPDLNGAGIRAEGRSLRVRHALFRDNENGILTDNDPAASLDVEFTEFADNGAGDGLSHNIYVGSIDEFVLRYSYSHGAKSGHLVKSRARKSLIEYNLLADGGNGSASYELEFPSGGEARVVGNLIVQSQYSENETVVSYAAEAKGATNGSLDLAFNTIVSEQPGGLFIQNHSAVVAKSVNNLFVGVQSLQNRGSIQSIGDAVVELQELPGAMLKDFRPVPPLPEVINASIPSGEVPTEWLPAAEPRDPTTIAPHTRRATTTVGALEACPTAQ